MNFHQDCVIVSDGNTALHRAVKRGNLKAVEVLCNNGADVNCAHPTSGYSPLRFAVENGDIEIIKYLLLQKADPLQTDFGGVNPLQVITEMDLKEVKELIRKNMVSCFKIWNNGKHEGSRKFSIFPGYFINNIKNNFYCPHMHHSEKYYSHL